MDGQSPEQQRIFCNDFQALQKGKQVMELVRKKVEMQSCEKLRQKKSGS